MKINKFFGRILPLGLLMILAFAVSSLAVDFAVNCPTDSVTSGENFDCVVDLQSLPEIGISGMSVTVDPGVGGEVVSVSFDSSLIDASSDGFYRFFKMDPIIVPTPGLMTVTLQATADTVVQLVGVQVNLGDTTVLGSEDMIFPPATVTIAPGPEETPTTEDCTTVTDDDEDGALNCADKDCNEHSSCVLNVVIGTSTCDNGIDDNDDGKIDYAGGCDTDGDGKLDLRGSGITSKTSCLTAIGFSITDAIELKPIKTTKGFSTVQTSGFREIFENADAPIRTTTESGSSSSLLDSVLDVDYYALDENCENITSSEVAVDPEVGSREDFLTAIGTLYDQAETDGWSLPLVSQVAFLLREAFLTE
ncbi:hypothetical protein HOC32_01260 [Candidatus Woesearchaeota archaeon]|nr:hypothetical protein [Candidatus Woesearchaeota archaeon]